jgi:uncharacterized protein with GYD domain
MPHYLLTGSYTADGAKALLAEGGAARKAQATALVKSLGGTVECFYFAFGTDDVVCVIDMPDSASATAASLTVSSSGKVSVRLTPLITPEEVDAASERSKGATYRAPGS